MPRIGFYLLLLMLFPACVFAFVAPGVGGAPILGLSGPTDLIRNVQDSAIYRKSSLTQTIKADKSALNGDPKEFLSGLLKDRTGYDFRLGRKESSAGVFVYHFLQTYKGLSVFGGEVAVRVSEKEGSVVLTGTFFKDIKVEVDPVYGAQSLADTARKVLNGGKQEGEARLGLLPTDGGFRLCYRIRVVKGMIEDYIFYMDARTGGVLRAFNRVNSLGH